jgi:hypothetical protein
VRINIPLAKFRATYILHILAPFGNPYLVKESILEFLLRAPKLPSSKETGLHGLSPAIGPEIAFKGRASSTR